MLLYDVKVQDEFARLRAYAERLREAFAAKRPVSELLVDAENLGSIADGLIEVLPEEVRGAGNMQRHFAWMTDYLQKGNSFSCLQDIEDICERDIDDLEGAYVNWRRRPSHYDDELMSKTGDLIARREFDSAVRKAFVILKTRLARKYTIADDLDGPELVNRIYGRAGHPLLQMTDSERQAARDLLSGLYGVFRNKYAHADYEAPWFEADAILSMINCILIRLGPVTRSRGASRR
jgi:hypothetical protein